MSTSENGPTGDAKAQRDYWRSVAADEQRTADFYFWTTMVFVVLFSLAMTAIAVLTYPSNP